MTTALERWNWMYAELNGRVAFGQPGVRDPDYPCDHFEPGDPQPNNTCDGDGHYMCHECCHLTLCADGCGQRPVQCECPDNVALARPWVRNGGGWLRVTTVR
jgi:hypothetical protein